MQTDLRRWMRVVEMATVPLAMLAPRYFHGSPVQHVKSILAHGIHPPDFVAYGTKNTALRPVKGRVYLSPDAKAAAMYGNYLFVVKRDSLGDLQPDEDEVGEIYHRSMQKGFRDLEQTRRIHANSPRFIARMELLNSPEQQHGLEQFKYYMNRVLTPNMKHEVVVNGEYAWWAKAGKAALKKMPADIVLWLIRLGVHVAHEGAVMPDEAWKITANGLLPDGSNLPAVATRLEYDKTKLTPLPPPRPPIKYRVTLEWNKNWAALEAADRLGQPRPVAIRKQRFEMITAPGDEEARQQAELIVTHTGQSAAYEIVSIERA